MYKRFITVKYQFYFTLMSFLEYGNIPVYSYNRIYAQYPVICIHFGITNNVNIFQTEFFFAT